MAQLPDGPNPRGQLAAIFKNSYGNMSAMGHVIHLMFGSMVGYSRMAYWTALLLVGLNLRWQLLPSWKFQMAIALQRVIKSTCLGLLGKADRTTLLMVGPNPIWWPVAILKISSGHISAIRHPIHLMSAWAGLVMAHKILVDWATMHLAPPITGLYVR